jgi:glucan biosynthesis protein
VFKSQQQQQQHQQHRAAVLGVLLEQLGTQPNLACSFATGQAAQEYVFASLCLEIIGLSGLASCLFAGFEWYDTTTTTILSNITFENYKYIQYTSDPSDWWYSQTPHAFRMLSHSDQFKPGECYTTQVTQFELSDMTRAAVSSIMAMLNQTAVTNHD